MKTGHIEYRVPIVPELIDRYGCTASVNRYRQEPNALVMLSSSNGYMSVRLNAAHLRELARRLIAAADDIGATT